MARKHIPKFSSEAEEEEFSAEHDSTEYVDWPKGQREVMSEESTCGHGIAEHAALHGRLSSLLETVGLNLELHLGSLDPADEASKPEYAAYTALVQQHREISRRIRSLADLMASYRDLPMANHDPSVLGSRQVIAAFESLVSEQEQLVELLRGWIDRDRALLEDVGDPAARGGSR